MPCWTCGTWISKQASSLLIERIPAHNLHHLLSNGLQVGYNVCLQFNDVRIERREPGAGRVAKLTAAWADRKQEER